MIDALVLGAGPAGATVARLLKARGYSVVLAHRPSAAPHSLAETLPPSIRNVFHLVGIQKQIDDAGFFRTTGNTSWWESERKRVETYGDVAGYQVLRESFDELLRTTEIGAEVPARFTLDCTGRTGVVAKQRGLRVMQPGFRTLALCGIWRGELDGVDESHTLVEAYADGWVWSIPLAADLRYITVMTSPGARYATELAKTRVMRKLLVDSVQQGKSWGCDASLYSSKQYCGDDFFLVGDAGSFVDPISSFGVKKALTSAWMAAATASTCIEHPENAAAALEQFEQCERQNYADHLMQAGEHYAKGAARFGTPFWTARAALHASQPNLRAALKRLRAASELHLKRGLRVGLEYYYGVHLGTLVEIAPKFRQVPEIYAAYNQKCAPVELPAFLCALSLLLARGNLL